MNWRWSIGPWGRTEFRHRRVVRAVRHEAPVDEESAETSALRSDRRARVLVGIAALSDRQRACVVLHYYAELNEREIAEAVGCSIGSVKTHLNRGRAALAERLGGEP